MDKHVWSRIILLTESNGDRHYMLIYKTMQGTLYSWDKRGASRLHVKNSKANDAKAIAKAIDPSITYAAWEHK